MAINKHGYKMIGLKATAGLTKCLLPYNGLHIQINYNARTGRVYGTEHVGNSYTAHGDNDIITIRHTYHPITMQDIADAIRDTMEEMQVRKAYYAEIEKAWAGKVWDW